MAQAMAGHAGHMAMAAPADASNAVPPPPSYTPFPAPRHAALDQLVDIIIPADETPGAKQAGVTGFIEMMYQHWMDDAERQRCDAELDLVMAAFKTGDPAANLRDGGRFRAPTLRKLTIYGYYTSEVGASEELDLNLVPGAYDACAVIGRNDRAPSLNTWGISLSLTPSGAA
ncbi:hypothetical protein ASE49_08375 [Novosphingobium sp. Leaf2]|nr:hypothetical protein ASE49_08375 [Novosphingobium sp. Leaf2]